MAMASYKYHPIILGRRPVVSLERTSETPRGYFGGLPLKSGGVWRPTSQDSPEESIDFGAIWTALGLTEDEKAYADARVLDRTRKNHLARVLGWQDAHVERVRKRVLRKISRAYGTFRRQDFTRAPRSASGVLIYRENLGNGLSCWSLFGLPAHFKEIMDNERKITMCMSNDCIQRPITPILRGYSMESQQHHKQPDALPIRLEDRFLSVDDVMAIIPVSKAWLAKHRAAGDGPPFSKIGGRVLYSYKGLLEYMQSHRPDVCDTQRKAA